MLLCFGLWGDFLRAVLRTELLHDECGQPTRRGRASDDQRHGGDAHGTHETPPLTALHPSWSHKQIEQAGVGATPRCVPPVSQALIHAITLMTNGVAAIRQSGRFFCALPPGVGGCACRRWARNTQSTGRDTQRAQMCHALARWGATTPREACLPRVAVG